MRKKLVACLLFTSLIANAQLKEKNDIEIAPCVGINSSNYYESVSYTGGSNKALFTPFFGITADFYVNNRWSLRTGLEYQTLGSSVYTSELINNPQDNYYYRYFYESEKLNFLVIPIHANIHIGKSRKWHINFGPTVSFLTGANFGGEKVEIDHLRKEHLGFGVGFGYRFNIHENLSLGIEHQEYISFTNNLNTFNSNGSFIGNIAGNFSVKAIFKLDSKSTNEE
ncbi:PorT family protein [Paenimyroides aestuarii]|uniref:PorT family protein n=1 Tax=Paenimyroides aestuarii TaxID=2968490 RepID=A0ABY5NPJ2_9FLAO|nr:PorT family protein [Paenimyroides aestuarii]UUV20470.1 PorT family protein [Paenimyroides aestuarii]